MMIRTLLPFAVLVAATASAQFDSVRVVTNTRIISRSDVPSTDVFDNSILLQPAVFVGGEEALAAYLTAAITYPAEAITAAVQGTVQVRFIVEADGMVNEVEVKEGVHPALDKEAVRVVLAMPDWTPARVRSAPVRASVVQPVAFALH